MTRRHAALLALAALPAGCLAWNLLAPPEPLPLRLPSSATTQVAGGSLMDANAPVREGYPVHADTWSSPGR